MSIRSHTFRNTLYSMAGTYTEYVLGMLTSVVIARYLGPEGLGVYSVAIWLVAMGVAVANSGSASTVIRFVAELRGADAMAQVPTMVAWTRRAQRGYLAVLLVLVVALVAIAGERFAPGMDPRLLIAFLLVAIASRASYMLNVGIAKGFEDFGIVARVALVGAPVNLVLVLVACWLGASLEVLLGVFCVSGLVFLVVSARLVAPLRRGHAPAPLDPGFMARVRRHMLLASATVSASFVAASEVEVVFLNVFTGQEAAGHFKAAYQLALGMSALVPGVFSALLLPMMASARAQGGGLPGRRFVSTTAYLGLLSSLLVAFALALSGPAIRTLFGEAYADAVPVFTICLVGAAMTAASTGASSLLISSDRQGTILALVLASCALKLALDLLLIPPFGLIGAACAFITVATAVVVAMFWLAMRQTGVAPDWARLARIGVAAGLAALAAMPAARGLAPLPGLLVGGVVLVLVHGFATLLLGCWTRADVEQMQALHRRLAGARLVPGARLLEWARRRAPEEASA